jgi:hypothetical protein
MDRHHTLALALATLASSLVAGPAVAQDTSGCPPGQPCVVVVPDAQPAETVVPPPPAGQGSVFVSPQGSGYVTVQPSPEAMYVTPHSPPAQERRRSGINWGMAGPGMGLLIGGWFGNWITGVVGIFFDETDADYFGWQWVPVIGPFVGVGYFAGSPHDEMLGMHLLWALMQSGGLVLCILGTVLTGDDFDDDGAYVLGDGPDAPRLSVSPWGSDSAGGISARLSF